MSVAFDYKEIEPDRAQIDMFVRSMFKHAKPGGYVSLRSFVDNQTTETFRISPVRLTGAMRETG